MICAALWWLLLPANSSVGKFLNCSSEVFCPCNEVGWVCSEGKVIPELWVCVPLTPESRFFTESMTFSSSFLAVRQLVGGCGTGV